MAVHCCLFQVRDCLRGKAPGAKEKKFGLETAQEFGACKAVKCEGGRRGG